MVSYIIGNVVYNIFFHPLSGYPGPKLWAATRIPHSYYWVKGTLFIKVGEMHREYGKVVRSAPNELSFIHEEAWRDIYGLAPGKAPLQKDTSYAIPNQESVGIVACQNREDHQRIRRNFSHAFSAKALYEQESIMGRHFDKLMTKLHGVADSGAQDLYRWYSYTSLDIISALTFGQSYNCLDSLSYPEVFGKLGKFVMNRVLLGAATHYHPLILWGLLRWAPVEVRNGKMEWHRHIRNLLDARLATKEAGHDFTSYVIRHFDRPTGLKMAEVQATYASFILGGSDTVAITLATATHYLLTSPVVLDKLKLEVRSAFTSEADITIAQVTNLKYLLAVIDEAMRINPALADGQTRVTGPEGLIVAGEHIPAHTSLSVSPWSAMRSPLHFRHPEAFVPERWLSSKEPIYHDDNKSMLQPFGMGARHCPGSKY
ncbi:hypothetical protein N8I77_010952 [Diaporthe amygdali]|uniref:Uncharacterized protein n=1 Tax=Phomopsis amygdali TaxID=1214568 RepID=A0AAD9S8B3_PHOAM|nr:hypothetical protein N8I77_010952 [Diaporthe amygdali]